MDVSTILIALAGTLGGGGFVKLVQVWFDRNKGIREENRVDFKSIIEILQKEVHQLRTDVMTAETHIEQLRLELTEVRSKQSESNFTTYRLLIDSIGQQVTRKLADDVWHILSDK
jgi:hypothetical protein